MNIPRATRTLCMALFALLCASGALHAQEEIGKKGGGPVDIEWATLESKNYFIKYESVIAGGVVKEIKDALEEILAQYTAIFKFTPKEKFKVKFLNNMRSYEDQGGDPSHPGYFNPGSGYLVIREMEFYHLIPTVYHEAFHQYLQAYLPKGTEIPTWFNEGLAMYYEGIQRNKQTKQLDPKLIDYRKIIGTRDAIMTRTAIPLEKLIDATHNDFHHKENEDLHYSQSFGFVYFLMQGMGGKPVMQYAAELKKSTDKTSVPAVALANEKIFGKGRKNMKAIERRWKEYVLGLKLEEK